MTPSDETSDAADRVAQHLRHVAETERAPDSLRSELRALEQGARSRTARQSTLRSARKEFSGKSARRTQLPAGPDLAAAVTSEPAENAVTTKTGLNRKRQIRLRALAVPAILVLVVAVMAIARSNGSESGPSVRQVASLAALSPADAAPKPDSSASKTKLAAAVQGLHFPNWTAYRGWNASGARQDELQGRRVTTVFYKHGGQQIAYSIVATPALTNIGRAADAHENFRLGGRNYVIWTDSNHTCMLSGKTLSSQKLWDLAESTIHA